LKPHDSEAFILSETLIRELEQTDRLIIATPMHNYTVPASLKLWIDYVLRYGRTFATEEGQKYGLLANRPTLIIVTSGGLVSPPAAMQPDHLTGYLRDVFATLGITDLRFVYLEGLVRHDMSDAIVAAGWDAIIEDHAFGESIAA
jgi:FMN-dependent NADH-azoreductase